MAHSVIASSTLIQPHVTLHFGVHVADWPSRRVLDARPQAVSRGVERFFVRHRETARSTSSLTIREWLRDPHRWSITAPERSIRATTGHVGGVVPRWGVSRAEGHTPQRDVRRTRVQPLTDVRSPRIREPIRQFSRRVEQPQRQSLTLAIDRPRLRHRSSSQHVVVDQPHQLQYRRRPAEILWREAAKHQAAIAASTTSSVALEAATARGASRGSSPSGSVSQEAPRATTVAIRMADLEPGLIDRLTDDVIRRVERRVRIERERRGL